MISRESEVLGGDDARLVSMLTEGLTTGEDMVVTPEFWRELKADAATILDKRKAAKT